MAAVTTAQNEADALRLMRGYLEAIPITTRALKRWVDDTVLVTDRLAALPAGPAGRLASRLELKGIGAFGHSMGGVTSAAFCAVDRHCQAALNLDGIPQYGTLIDSPMNRPFMEQREQAGRAGNSAPKHLGQQRILLHVPNRPAAALERSGISTVRATVVVWRTGRSSGCYFRTV